MDMVEKVAQAVCLAQWGGYPLERKEREEWPQWAQAMKVARAAIDAMREPTDEMKAVAEFADISHSYGGRDSFDYVGKEDAGNIFRMMISAALKEQEKVG